MSATAETIADPMQEIDALAGIVPEKTTESPPEQEKASEQPKEAEKEPEKEVSDQTAPDTEKPPVEAKESQEEQVNIDSTLDEMFPRSEKFTRSKPLREAYDKALDSLSELRKENEELKKKFSSDDLVSGLTEKNRIYEEKIASYERQQALIDYKSSREYREKYADPLDKAIEDGAELMAEMQIKTQNGVRSGNREDFIELMDMGTREAGELASELFGPSAMMIMNLRHQARQMRAKGQQALKNAEENVAEIMRNKAVEEQEQKAYAQKIWEAASKKITTRFPEIFGDDPTDPEYGQMIRKGLGEFDVAIQDNPQVTQEQRLTLLAGMRYRAAALPAVMKRYRASLDRIEELEEQVSKFQKSDPDSAGDGGKGKGQGKTQSWEDDPDAPWAR